MAGMKTLKIIAFVAVVGNCLPILAALTSKDAKAIPSDQKPQSQAVEMEFVPYPGSILISHSVQPSSEFLMPVGKKINGRLIRGVASAGGPVQFDVYKNPEGAAMVDIKNKYSADLKLENFRILNECHGKECSLKDSSDGLGLPITHGSYYIAAEKQGTAFNTRIGIHITSSDTYVVTAKGILGGWMVDTSPNSYDLIGVLMDLLMFGLLILCAIYRAHWWLPPLIIPFLSLAAFAIGEYALSQEHLIAPIRIDLFYEVPMVAATFVVAILKQIQQARFHMRKQQRLKKS